MPLVSVVLAVHDDARYIGAAVDSVLGQSFTDWELIVVDDASTDDTPDLLGTVSDRRLRVVRSDEQLGLAASLNRGLHEAGGRFVARLDADDVALPDRLERQLEAMQASAAGIVGSAIRDLDEEGREGRLHRMPLGPRAVRWHALFSSPFFHPTVLVDREKLGALRYDTSYLESEDYDLWTRLLATGVAGGNLEAPLVLKRVHAGQASLRRRDLQRCFQRQVALREITRVAPGLTPEQAEAAWAVGSGLEARRRGVRPFVALLKAFERAHGVDRHVRKAAAKAVVRACV
jgi:glycosyltransferase involved in cell wall biosynthesis